MALKSSLKFDKILFFSIILLLILGLVIFLSASLGILPQNELKFILLLKSQLFYSLILAPVALYLGFKIEYFYYRKLAIFIFILSYLVSFLVLVPGLGFSYNGATRWIHLFGFSLQPSEILKLGTVILFSFLVLKYKKYFNDYKFGLLLFIFIWILLTIPVLFIQKDFGTMAIILLSSFIVYCISGAKRKYIAFIFLLSFLFFVILLEIRPYMKERILTFLDSDRDVLGSSYQITQSLIAVGAGQIYGRGIGQSIQKFNYLPEQISDSIFAVYAEEVGFIGSLFLIAIFTFIALRSIFLIKQITDPFGVFLGIGIISIFFFQFFLNIAATIGFLPLTGIPLPLVSRGGTSLVIVMFELGILLNISKYRFL